jgi:alpha-tubulin suppressor-like RCC1 family protein
LRYPTTSNITTISITVVDETATLAMSSQGDLGCVVLHNEIIACWGTQAEAPYRAVLVPGLSSVANVVMGGNTACAVVKQHNVDGSLLCWQLTPSNLDRKPTFVTSSPLPQLVQGLPGSVLDAVAGDDHVCALVRVSTDTGGQVYCWGHNEVGQLGQGDTNGFWGQPDGSRTPLRVDGLSNVTALYAGFLTTCAKTATRQIHCWGYDSQHMLPIGIVGGIVERPTRLQQLCA